MALNRDTRRIQNSKQDAIHLSNSIPSSNTLPDGSLMMSFLSGSQLGLFTKQKGKIWRSYFTADGNQYIDKNLEVKGNATLRNNLTVKSDLTVDGEIKGTRAYFDGGEAATFDAGRYLDFNNGVQMGTSLGYRMHRAGSIIGVSAQFSVTNNGSDSYATIQVRNNGSSVFSVNSSTLSGTPTYQTGMTGTQNRGTDTFVAGNILTLYANISADVTNGTVDDFCAFFEVVFDD